MYQINFTSCGFLSMIFSSCEKSGLKDCQTPSRLLLAATVLVIQGGNLAANDDLNGALANFRQAKEWDKNLQFDPQAKAQEFANKGKAKRKWAEWGSVVQKGQIRDLKAGKNPFTDAVLKELTPP